MAWNLFNSYISGNVARIKYDKHICLYMNRKAKVACDLSKAFDKVNHNAPYIKTRNVGQ